MGIYALRNTEYFGVPKSKSPSYEVAWDDSTPTASTKSGLWQRLIVIDDMNWTESCRYGPLFWLVVFNPLSARPVVSPISSPIWFFYSDIMPTGYMEYGVRSKRYQSTSSLQFIYHLSFAIWFLIPNDKISHPSCQCWSAVDDRNISPIGPQCNPLLPSI